MSLTNATTAMHTAILGEQYYPLYFQIILYFQQQQKLNCISMEVYIDFLKTDKTSTISMLTSQCLELFCTFLSS